MKSKRLLSHGAAALGLIVSAGCQEATLGVPQDILRAAVPIDVISGPIPAEPLRSPPRPYLAKNPHGMVEVPRP